MALGLLMVERVPVQPVTAGWAAGASLEGAWEVVSGIYAKGD